MRPEDPDGFPENSPGMARSRDFVWLAVALALTAIGAALLRSQSTLPPGPDFRLLLILAPDKAHDYPYVLEVHQTPGGAHWKSEFRPPGASQPSLGGREGDLTVTEFVHFRRRLEEAGLWTVPDGSEKTPGGLYTEIAVQEGSRHHRSTWIGLPTQKQQNVADAFLNGPLGKEIREGLSTAR